VLRKDFVADHVALSGKDRFLTGRRVELSPEATQILNPDKIKTGYLDSHPWALYADALRGGTQSLGRFFKTPKFLRALLGRNKILDIRGCNFSVHKTHILSINGYSNDFSGAYGEDSDLEYRLKFLGLKMIGCKGAAIQFHLWHPTQNKDSANQLRLKKVLDAKDFYAENGLKEASTLT
jgi:GT2 family glycosyltransferase